jgi:hypothetical protein
MAACFVSQRVATKSKLMLRAVNVTHAAAARLLSPLAHHQRICLFYIHTRIFLFPCQKSVPLRQRGVFFSSGAHRFFLGRNTEMFRCIFHKTRVAAVGLGEGCVNQFIRNVPHSRSSSILGKRQIFTPTCFHKCATHEIIPSSRASEKLVLFFSLYIHQG